MNAHSPISADEIAPQTVQGKPCKRGHTLRYAKTNNCAECARARAIKWQNENPDRAKTNWRNRDRDKVRERSKARYDANRDVILRQTAEYSKKNPGVRYRANRNWVEKNPHKRAMYNLKRRKAVERATPVWADHKAIEAFYIEAQRLTAETGVRHSVDHIFPLLGSNVCGLHVPANLRVIPFVENVRKGNRFAGDF